MKGAAQAANTRAGANERIASVDPWAAPRTASHRFEGFATHDIRGIRLEMLLTLRLDPGCRLEFGGLRRCAFPSDQPRASHRVANQEHRGIRRRIPSLSAGRRLSPTPL